MFEHFFKLVQDLKKKTKNTIYKFWCCIWKKFVSKIKVKKVTE